MSKILRSLKRILILLVSGPYIILSRIWVQLLIIAVMFFFGARNFQPLPGTQLADRITRFGVNGNNYRPICAEH